MKGTKMSSQLVSYLFTKSVVKSQAKSPYTNAEQRAEEGERDERRQRNKRIAVGLDHPPVDQDHNHECAAERNKQSGADRSRELNKRPSVEEDGEIENADNQEQCAQAEQDRQEDERDLSQVTFAAIRLVGLEVESPIVHACTPHVPLVQQRNHSKDVSLYP